SVGADGQCPALSTNTGIHHRQMYRALGKLPPCPSENIRGSPHVPRRQRVGDVHERGPRRAGKQHTLQLGDVGVGRAEIGEEGDERRNRYPRRMGTVTACLPASAWTSCAIRPSALPAGDSGSATTTGCPASAASA